MIFSVKFTGNNNNNNNNNKDIYKPCKAVKNSELISFCRFKIIA